jgi:serine protease AprX
VPKNVDNALWGKKDGGARPRVLAAAAVAVVAALAVPAIGRAADVPAPLLAQAQANPTQTFNVIIQTDTATPDPTLGTSTVPTPATTTANALSSISRRAFYNAVRAAQAATQKLNDLAGKLSDAQNAVAAAQAKSDAAAAKAAQTGNPGDINDATKKAADLAAAQAALSALQDAVNAAQSTAVLTQLALVTQQTRFVSDFTQAVGDIRWQYTIIPAVAASVTGADVASLAAADGVVAITADNKVSPTGVVDGSKWPDAIGAKQWWSSPIRKAVYGKTPTIAIVDSGVDSSRVADFGGRLLGQVNLASLSPNSPGDGRGHGTMVADLAAGGANSYTGVNPDAPMISLDVLNDNGEGRTSDVIAAADWILANRNTYNIRVANFSLDSAIDSSFMFDPLSKAVEQLWFNGVVVVAASGNYAVNGAQSGVRYAPASDPFVITVGAVDIGNDAGVGNDKAAPWSAWGYTNDGFLKPEISAPGRYLAAACPPGSTLSAGGGQNPSLRTQGYLQLSGTSFAAPLVSGAAAALLAEHPDWSPDQVKGWLMLTANKLPQAVPGSVGVGELDVKDALLPGGNLWKSMANPPNPNQGLDQFVVQTQAGPVFDAASWSSAAQANASWNSASWSSASWSSASWSSASWSSASWSSASWSSASWSSASWSSASWSSSINGTTFADNAAGDMPGNS